VEFLNISVFAAFGCLFILMLFLVARTEKFLDHVFLYIAACGMSDFAKRLIYVAVDTDISLLYYACLLFPDILFLFIMLRSRRRVSLQRLLWVGLLMALLFGHGIVFAGPASVIVAYKTYAMLMVWFVLDRGYFSITASELHSFLLKLLALVAICGVYGVIQFVAGYFIWEVNWFSFSPTGMKMVEVMNNGKLYRAFSVFSGVQEYSMIIIYVMSLAAFLLKGWQRLLWLALMAAFLISSGSKTAFLAMIIAGLCYKLKIYKRFTILIACMAAPLVYIYTRTGPEIWGLVNVVRQLAPASLVSLVDPGTIVPRIAVLGEFFKIDQNARTILIGHGFGASRGAIIFDNSYLMVMYEVGVVGLSAFMYALLKFFKSASRIIELSTVESDRVFAQAQVVFMVSAMLSLFVSQNIGIRTFFILFASCIVWVATTQTSGDSIANNNREGERCER
jgi:hypothetical protein